MESAAARARLQQKVRRHNQGKGNVEEKEVLLKPSDIRKEAELETYMGEFRCACCVPQT